MSGDRYGIWVVELAGFDVPIGAWLKFYDPDGADGAGDVVVTLDPKQAKVFPSLAAALDEWRRVSTVRPLRDDGRPNRPLSAFTVQPQRLPE